MLFYRSILKLHIYDIIAVKGFSKMQSVFANNSSRPILSYDIVVFKEQYVLG